MSRIQIFLKQPQQHHLHIMPIVSNLIPHKRLKWLPVETRLAHEYCFFLHDEFARMLVEYELAKAHHIKITLKNKTEHKKFSRILKTKDPITALRALGRDSEARRAVVNTITIAMVSDCAHHIYESLRCFEKRKFIPAFNLLRKPLLDSLIYFSWMVADEDDFFNAFSSGDPSRITQKIIGNRRKEIIEKAIKEMGVSGLIQSDDIISHIFDARNENGLYGLFQHAVHLVTIDRIEIKTAPENFNFIFKDPWDDDIYKNLYNTLPTILLFTAHLIMTLFDRIKPMEGGAKKAFLFRTTSGHLFLKSKEDATFITKEINNLLSPYIKCKKCRAQLRVTQTNAARLLFTDSYRCTYCKKTSPFPFSWIFQEEHSNKINE